MAKKVEMIPDDSFRDNGLTRINPTTKFVIEHETGLILFIFKDKEKDQMIRRLLDDKIVNSLSDLKYNAYNDILIINKNS